MLRRSGAGSDIVGNLPLDSGQIPRDERPTALGSRKDNKWLRRVFGLILLGFWFLIIVSKMRLGIPFHEIALWKCNIACLVAGLVYLTDRSYNALRMLFSLWPFSKLTLIRCRYVICVVHVYLCRLSNWFSDCSLQSMLWCP